MKKKLMCMAVFGLFAVLSIPAFAAVIALNVPNYSFEAPATSTFGFEVAGWEDPGNTGVFNNRAGFGNMIINADGNQMVFMNCYAGGAGADKNNMFADLPYILTRGTYKLTVGVAARSDSKPTDPANTKMELRLFTRVPALTVLAKKEVVYGNLKNNELTYYTATLNSADIPAESIGYGFGIWLDSTVGTTGGDWTLDNVTLSVIPMTASNPTPANGQTGVGTATGSNSDVAVQLGWTTGRDPNDQINPDVTSHYLYIAASEPNYVGVAPIVIPAGTPTADTASSLLTLTMDKTYFWRVDEAIKGSSPTDPNTILGQVWSFETMKSIPVIVSHPQDQLVALGQAAELSVDATSISTASYQWYKSIDNANNTLDDDIPVGINANTLTFNNIILADEGYYYCVVNNASGTPVWSNAAFLEIKRLVGWYAFENDIVDSAGDNDGTSLKTDPNNPFNYADGRIGKAIVLNGTDDAVQISRSVQSSFTIALWVKTTVTGGDGGWWTGRGLVDGDMSGAVKDFGTSVRGSKFGFGVGPDTTISSASSINDDLWHYCVATRDHVTGQMKVYVDGLLETSATGPIGRNDAPDFLQIGKIRTGYNYLTGQIDDVKLYNYPLSDLEIAQTYYAVTGQSVCLKSEQPAYDLNDDCKVDLADFSLLAGQWMDCAIVPDCIQ
ncbi:MAG: LamG-like jellyroll fold domain-containing protein [Anaerohalosphaeraceae bacterium]